MKSVIVAHHLTKRFGQRLAVDDVSLEVSAGEVLGLLGPNGSGKTTILRILTGYLHASAGCAFIAGFDVVKQGLEARRRIGYVPENTPLYSNMRVDEFLSFMGRLKGLSATQLSAAVDAGCSQLSLDEVRRMPIGNLSQGYRQRVMVAQALLNDPDLLILDEPTNGLDPRQIIEVRDLIRYLAARHTILVTSHILGEIERVATRVAILLKGRLLTIQTMDQSTSPKLRLRVRSTSPETVRATINTVSGVTNVPSVTPVSNGVEDFVVEVEERSVAEALAAALAAGGFGLLEMTETRTDLDGLFLDITS
jgi:ABC-2 type transport system ATP-binding protein